MNTVEMLFPTFDNAKVRGIIGGLMDFEMPFSDFL